MPLTERLSSRVAAEALALAGSEPRGVPAVIDTNVVLDLIYWEDPHSEDLRRALEEGRIHALRSGEAVMELAEVLSRPAFTGDEDEAARLAALWCSMSVPVDEEKIREAADVITVQCRDPLDQKFFTLTLAGGAKLLVSKDKLVLKDGRRWRKVVPKGKSDELDELNLAIGELCARPITIKYLSDEGGDTCVDFIESTETEAM